MAAGPGPEHHRLSGRQTPGAARRAGRRGVQLRGHPLQVLPNTAQVLLQLQQLGLVPGELPDSGRADVLIKLGLRKLPSAIQSNGEETF